MRVGLALVGVAVLAAGCSHLTGSGHVVTKNVSVSSFSRLEVGSAFDVRVSIGPQPELALHVDDNLLGRVEAGVSGDTLRIKLEPGLTLGHATLKADVTAPSLTEIRVSGASHVVLADEVSAPNLALDISGASEVDGPVGTTSLSLYASGASRARLQGSSTRVSVDGNGASQLELESLLASTLDATLSGASQATVSVSESLSVDLSGASQLRYRGTPSITHQEVSGASQLERI
jgi:Putative auto-transporter adhesin, head GIN domain